MAAFALQHKLPTVSGWAVYAIAGGLVTYGPDRRASWKHLASYVDRILKGAETGSLPFEFPTLFELVINLNAARTLGAMIPQSVMLRVDRVIE